MEYNKIIRKRLVNNNKHVIIIGDLILDEYVVAYPERISREAPVMILEYKKNYYKLGGAANAALNARIFDARVTLIGITGDDKEADILTDLCKQNDIDLQILRVKGRHTTLKTRIEATNQSSELSNAGNSSQQQVLRVDRYTRERISDQDRYTLHTLISNSVREDTKSILLSDYKLDVLAEDTVQYIMSHYKNSIKIIADPQNNIRKYKDAYLITPNQPDTERDLNQTIKSMDFDTLGVNMLITRGADGMTLIVKEGKYSIPAFNLIEVCDVTGAGDTVSACLTVAVANNVPLYVAMVISNRAAAVAVRKAGCATVSYDEICKDKGDNI